MTELSLFKRRTILVICTYSIIALALAFLLADDYGQGWDDAHDEFYGRVVSKAYTGSQEYFEYQFESYYGPAYYLFQYRAEVVLAKFLPDWQSVHLRYLTNFGVFQLGVIALFALTRRFAGTLAGGTVTLLFISQPLLFGHGFINHKDGVFLSVFLIAVTLGVLAVDALVAYLDRGASRSIRNMDLPTRTSLHNKLAKPWGDSAHRFRWVFVLSGILLLVFALELLGVSIIRRPLLDLVENAYQDQSIAIVNRLFDQIAENQRVITLESYISKTNKLFDRISFGLLFLMAGIVLLSARVIFGSLTPRSGYRLPLLGAAAAAFLGIATAIRIAGPFAGLLVSVYFILRLRLRGIWFLIPYAAVAYLTTFILWPALWVDPIRHLIETFQTMSHFPAHQVLFNGAVLDSYSLPREFVPVLLVLQLTEPILVLIALGLVMVAWSVKEKNFAFDPRLTVVVIWIAVPMLAIALLGLPLYGNFRHYLFIVPPIFIIAAFPLQKVFEMVHSNFIRISIAAAVLIPGIVSISNLHPYEYIYYNSLVGGVNGAQGRYELDYWCTSYREAIEFLNVDAPLNSEIVVWGPRAAAQTFARPDLVLIGEGKADASPDYALACSRALGNPDFFAGLPIVNEVNIDGSTIARTKSRPPDP